MLNNCERGGARSPLGTVIGFAAPARLGVTMRRPAPSTEADEATTAGRRKVDVATCAGSTIVTRNRGTSEAQRKTPREAGAGGGRDGRRAGTGAKRGRPSKPAAKPAKKKGG